MYAEVLPNAPVASAFHYRIPPELESTLRAGHLVQISFGKQLLQGIVVGLTDELPEGLSETDLKFIDTLIDSNPVLTRDQLDLAYYIANRYLAPLADCLFLMLPPGLAKQGDAEYDLADLGFDAESDTQFRLIELIKKRGPLRGRQIDRALPKRNWKPAAATLVKKGVLTKRPVLQPPTVRPKQIRTARLLIPPAQVPAAQFRLRHSPRAADLLDYLFSLYPGQPALPDLLKILNLTQTDLDPLVEKGWIALTEPEPVVAATYPPDVMLKWIDKNGGKYPEAALVLHALCDSPVARVANLESLVSNPQILTDTIHRLDQHDLLRHSVNPPRVILKLNGVQLKTQTALLRKPSKRAAVLDYLAGHAEPAPVSWIYAETGAEAAHLKELADQDLIDLGAEEIVRDPLAGKIFAPTEFPRLTLDQQGAWEAIDAAFALTAAQSPISNPPFLLHGVTGSGKTEIYLRAVARTLEVNRRAIILVSDNRATVRGHSSQAETIRLALEAGVTVYSLKTAGEATPLTMKIPVWLGRAGSVRRITEETGGEILDVRGAGSLGAALAGVISRLKTRYTLGYQSTNAARDGSFRKIDVTLTERFGRPGLNYSVHARRGYYAPTETVAQTKQ